VGNGIAIRNETDREIIEDIRNADVDTEGKEMRLQGPTDQLVLRDDPDAEELRRSRGARTAHRGGDEFKPGTEAWSRS